MMALLAMSNSTFRLLFYLADSLILLPICALYVITLALMVGLPVVEIWQALMRWLRAAPSRLKQALVDLPTNLLSLTITGGIALGVIDAVKLERSRIDRERRAAVRDIHALRLQAVRRMSQIVRASTNTNPTQGVRS